jgi:hypothetical protein
MSEVPKPSEESKELLPPALAFRLVKTAQLFAKQLLEEREQASSWVLSLPIDTVPGEPVDEKTKSPQNAMFFDLQYVDKDRFLGDLREWDGALFSFKKQELEERNHPQLSILVPLEPVDHPALEVSYDTGKYEEGAVGGIDVVVPFEGPARIKETTIVVKRDDEAGMLIGPEGNWREMTEAEGLGLETDLLELITRLDRHIEDGGSLPTY